jgi:3-methyladenine DNA glycosylase/8-oxoguanine DNA glycosylase
VEVSDGLVPALLPLRAAVRRIFDLDAEPSVIGAHFAGDDLLGPVSRALPGLRLPGCPDPFEAAVRAVLGQQISVAGARTLAGRLTAVFGEPLPGGPTGLTHFAPRAERLA